MQKIQRGIIYQITSGRYEGNYGVAYHEEQDRRTPEKVFIRVFKDVFCRKPLERQDRGGYVKIRIGVEGLKIKGFTD